MDTAKKTGRYERIASQLQELLTKTTNPIARMATISAVLFHKFDYYFWCGFYFVDHDKLIVGPYQGPVACQILQGSGVCVSSALQRQTVIVPNVYQFPGHIACDSRSKSEIVVPVFDTNGNILAVLDVDSTTLESFDETDRQYLEKIAAMVFVSH